MKEQFTFQIRVNGGKKQDFTVRTSIYQEAAAAVPAVLGYDTPCDVEIWCDDLLPQHGPSFYRVTCNPAGITVVELWAKVGGKMKRIPEFEIPGARRWTIPPFRYHEQKQPSCKTSS